MARSPWTSPPHHLVLRPGEIHLWRTYVRHEEALPCWPLLSEDEQARAGRFRFHQDRDRYVAARGVLRSILGLYLEIPPRSLRFKTARYGKPFLASPPSAPTLQFNVSHAKDLALYAITQGPAVGIDVEQIRPEHVDEKVAEQFLSPGELDHFHTLPIQKQDEAFFQYWTCKEAFAKALGMGLQAPLRRVTLSLTPEQHVFFSEDGQAAQRWDIITLPIDPGYAAALAVEHHDWSLHFWDHHNEAPLR